MLIWANGWEEITPFQRSNRPMISVWKLLNYPKSKPRKQMIRLEHNHVLIKVDTTLDTTQMIAYNAVAFESVERLLFDKLQH